MTDQYPPQQPPDQQPGGPDQQSKVGNHDLQQPVGSHPSPGGHHQPSRRKKRRTINKILLSVIGTFLLLIIIIAVATSGGKTGNSSSSASSSAPTAAPVANTPAPTPAPVALTASQQKFASDMQTAFNFNSSVTSADLAAFGEQICSDRRAGESQSQVIVFAEGYFSDTGQSEASTMANLAETDLCHHMLPPPTVVFSLAGSGIENSAPFPVNSGTLTVRYTYNCAAMGTSNFIADMISGSPSGLNYDDQSIANALGAGGSETTTVYPQDVGSDYHLSVIAGGCTWSIVVETAG